MLDIGFSEILVIFVLALIVLGPEKLPGVVRKVGRWVGRARAMARQFQEQLEEEIDVDGSRARPAPLPPDPPVYTETSHPSAPSEAAPAVQDAANPRAESGPHAAAAGTVHPTADAHEPRA